MRHLFILIMTVVFALGYAENTMIVSYATTHLNGISDSIVGVLVTPSGEILKTRSMGPFAHCTILVNSPEVGTYQAYFEALSTGTFRLCPIVGGIGILLSDQPEEPIAVSPLESRIQSFAAGRQIEVGCQSQPICYFQIMESNL